MAAERGEAVLKTAVRWTRAAVEGVTSKLLNIVYRGEESILPEVTNDLLLESACNLAARIRTGELKSRALVQAYIRRIIAVDPVINAVVDERFIEALDEAARVDELVASGRKTVDEIERETPFLGIPFSAKEATLVKGLSSTSGLMCRQGLKANRDCEAVALLKGAGAILLVVTNTSELCMWWETYNKLHGRTNNPYDITRTSGGSSGGEAALIASAGSVIGIATDLGGSIRLPAFFNGVFGHKPSQGAVPHGGQFPPILQQVSPYVVTGPMSRYASDLLPMLRVLADGEARRLDLHSKVSLRSLRVFYVLDKGDFSAMTPVQPEITNALLEVKSLEVVEVFIARIEEVQPIINAVVDSRFEEAREEAKAIDDFIRSGEKSEEQLADETPLLGVPFTSKNVVPVKGLLCSAGLVARRSTRATEDCAAVALMRRAGAIPLATTNSSEMCMWWAESYNLVHGRTSNPYNTSRTAGGSSGGEGALLGAAGSVIGLGNDIGGSVRFPAFCNGIFAHKATTGIISNRGQIPPLTGKLDEYQATGPMCRYASDLRTVLSVLACDHADRLRLHSPVNLKTLKMYYMEDDGGHPFVTPVHRDVKHALKKVTSTDVVRAYISRIRDVQPAINAVVDERFEEALEEARLVDNLIMSGEKTEEEMERQTPLLGVPLSVKEAISVNGLLFTAGVVSRRGIRAKEDADVVTLLRNAGAIPLVVTNTSEQCFWMEAYNNVYGRTNNPYDTNRTAGGSSGGEGALIASAASIIGIGNDIGGSIRIPAFFNGVFGHKPSKGVVPNRGHFPDTEPSLQQFIGTGPMCRYAEDLATMMTVMAGDHAGALQLNCKVEMKDVKVFFMPDDGGCPFSTPVQREVKQAFKKVIDHFRRTCRVPPQRVDIGGLKRAFELWAYVVSPGVAHVQPLSIRVLGKTGKWAVLRELCLWTLGLSDHILPVLITVLLEELTRPRHEAQADKFRRIEAKLEQDFGDLLQAECVFLIPTMPEPAPHHYVNFLRPFNCGYVAGFNALGLPATHCPVTLTRRGLPVGVQVVAAHGNDRLCLAVAKELEEAFGGWVSPGPVV